MFKNLEKEWKDTILFLAECISTHTQDSQICGLTEEARSVSVCTGDLLKPNLNGKYMLYMLSHLFSMIV